MTGRFPGPTAGLWIRRAGTPDLPQIRDLLQMCAAEGLLLAESPEEIISRLPDTWVARVSQRVIACGSLCEVNGPVFELRGVAVSRLYRGEGIGTRLVGALLDDARRRRGTHVLCMTFRIAFFKAAGFVPYGEGDLIDESFWRSNTLGNTRMVASVSCWPNP